MKSVGAIGAALAAASLSAAAAQYGPGSGPWEVTTPEAEGLSTAALRAADEAVESGMGGRVCYVVVKNGKIVHERYMGSGTEDGIRSSWSATKSMCASLYGIAVQEGWADVNDKVGDRNEGTRLCNADAEFRHVLTMTGTSPDIQSPQYSYDTLGTNCLDTLQDFIMQNNPDGLTTSDWMQRKYFERLGIEHSRWLPAAGALLCGFSADTSCRDLARMGQLWANQGVWPAGPGEAAEQMMSREYAEQGSRVMFPNAGRDYGYTLPLSSNDPVDPRTGSFVGMNAQCVQFSPEHNAVIVSMGNGGGCGTSWTQSRAAIVSNDHPMYNSTRAAHPAESFKQQAARAAAEKAALKQEVLALAPFMQEHAGRFSAADLKQFNDQLVEFGGQPVVAAH